MSGIHNSCARYVCNGCPLKPKSYRHFWKSTCAVKAWQGIDFVTKVRVVWYYLNDDTAAIAYKKMGALATSPVTVQTLRRYFSQLRTRVAGKSCIEIVNSRVTANCQVDETWTHVRRKFHRGRYRPRRKHTLVIK